MTKRIIHLNMSWYIYSSDKYLKNTNQTWTFHKLWMQINIYKVKYL
jgi:hypothetical protein